MKALVVVVCFVLSFAAGAVVMSNGQAYMSQEELVACKSAEGCTAVSNKLLMEVYNRLVQQDKQLQELRGRMCI